MKKSTASNVSSQDDIETKKPRLQSGLFSLNEFRDYSLETC